MWFSDQLVWLTAVIVGILIVEINSANTQQQLMLYGNNRQGKSKSNNNSYKNEIYTSNTRDLELVSPIIRDGRLKSACVQVGLWAIFYGKHYTNIASILYASSDSNDRTCTQNKINETHYSSYQSIRYVGNADLRSPGISLYKEKFFSGEELYFDGNILSLPTVQEFNSYGFTGRENWTLFSNQNFEGETVCLASKDLKEGDGTGSDGDGHNIDGIIYNKISKGPILVGSILKGCIEQSNRTVIFPNGQSIVQWTTKPKQLFEEDKNYTTYIKLYSEFEPDQLITDAKELRLPSKHSFPSFALGPGNADSNNWTVFTETELNGQAKCFFTNPDHEPTENDVGFNSTVTSDKDYIVIVASIKEGCVKPITVPIIEQHQLPKLEVATAGNPSNSLFFTSFIIGLIIFLLIIIASIFLIIYFYCSSKRRRRRREQ